MLERCRRYRKCSSSTLEDLEAFRAAASKAIRRLEWVASDCGYWAAGPNNSLETCLKKVDEADVVIVAHRHGWTPLDQSNDEHKSITRLECERAKANGKDVISFLVEEDAEWDPQLFEAHALHKAKGAERQSLSGIVLKNLAALEDFKTWLGQISTRGKSFTNQDQLETEVFHALTEWAKRQGHDEARITDASVRGQYLDWLRRRCESVELLGLDLKDSQNVRLGQVYVPAITAGKPNVTTLHADGAFREQRYALLLERLGEESLYVPGAPGSGKSTFCRWAALVAVLGQVPPHPVANPDEFEERIPDSLRDRFPLLCRLREWSGHAVCLEGNGTWTRAQLEDSLACWIERARPGGLSADVFRAELKQGRCLLILDGVDEVPESSGAHYPRRNLLTGLADALPDWIQSGNRVLLTSRPYGLDEIRRRSLRLTTAELAALPEELQAVFVHRWYAAADPARAKEKAQGLMTHLAERPDLNELRPNPMLLTALCIKYDEGQRLPKDFFRLYADVVSQVLHKRYLDSNERDRVQLRLAAVALGMHRGTAQQPRTTPAAEVSSAEVDKLLADLTSSDPTTESGAMAAAERREDLLSNSGLLLPRENQRVAFYHLSFQEFFAALRLRRLEETTEQILARHAGTAEWRRTLTFLFCAVADQDSAEAAAQAYATLLPRLEKPALADNPNPALLLADCLEVAHARGWHLDRFAVPFRNACDAALDGLAPPERAHLWRTLGHIGLDDRPGVGVRDGIPDIDWVEIPAGEFLYGEDRTRRTLDNYRIARYPVTHAQYQCFIDDDGYADDRWWEGLAERPEPLSPRWPYTNHPREAVCWYEAVAYCRWLNAKLGACGMRPADWCVRLPTEQEWEKAARDGWPQVPLGRVAIRLREHQ